jgi:mRNA interferase HigB
VRVIARKALSDFWRAHPDAEGPLRAWFHEVSGAVWRGPADVRSRYASASFCAGNRIVFNIGGHKYRLIVRVKYEVKLVLIRFIGTHRQYDNIDADEV